MECRATVQPGPDFGIAVPTSDSAAAAFMPAIAAREGAVVIVWQETLPEGNRVAYSVVSDGCVGALHHVRDDYANPRRPDVVATASGFVLAYEAREAPRPLIRFITLDPAGGLLSPPETISAPGQVGSRVRLAASGEDVVFSWTSATEHYVARRGPVETLAATPVGTVLEAPGLINFPRIGLAADGTIYLVYRDGGPSSVDYEVLLSRREVGGAFSRPINVSETSGLMSDDMDLAVEPDGTVRVVWVEQDKDQPQTFEVVHTTVRPGDRVRRAVRLQALGLAAFMPNVTRGQATVWQVGSVSSGRLFFSPGPGAPVQHILPEYRGAMVAIESDEAGDLHLAFIDVEGGRRLRYAWRRTR